MTTVLITLATLIVVAALIGAALFLVNWYAPGFSDDV